MHARQVHIDPLFSEKIINPHALPMFREEKKNTKRGREKVRMHIDPSASPYRHRRRRV